MPAGNAAVGPGPGVEEYKTGREMLHQWLLVTAEALGVDLEGRVEEGGAAGHEIRSMILKLTQHSNDHFVDDQVASVGAEAAKMGLVLTWVGGAHRSFARYGIICYGGRTRQTSFRRIRFRRTDVVCTRTLCTIISSCGQKKRRFAQYATYN